MALTVSCRVSGPSSSTDCDASEDTSDVFVQVTSCYLNTTSQVQRLNVFGMIWDECNGDLEWEDGCSIVRVL